MTVSSKIYLCDTNVIVRYLLGETTEPAKIAIELLDQTASGQVKVIMMEAVFVETIFVLSKVYKVPRLELSQTMSNLLQYRGIINEAKSIWLLALELYRTSNLHIVDCLLITKAKQSEIQLVTFDKQLEKMASSLGERRDVTKRFKRI